MFQKFLAESCSMFQRFLLESLFWHKLMFYSLRSILWCPQMALGWWSLLKQLPLLSTDSFPNSESHFGFVVRTGESVLSIFSATRHPTAHITIRFRIIKFSCSSSRRRCHCTVNSWETINNWKGQARLRVPKPTQTCQYDVSVYSLCQPWPCNLIGWKLGF